jgi:hypothetical protein
MIRISNHISCRSRCLSFHNNRIILRKCATISTNDLRYAATIKWLNTVVIGEKLCPFAPPVKKAPELRVKVSNASSHDDIIRDITSEAHLLMEGLSLSTHNNGTKGNAALEVDPSAPETTLVVLDEEECTSLKNFHDLVRLSWRVQEEAINQHGYTNDLQLVLFHPKATHDTYTEQSGDDAADYTIRSPYPVIHLLRQADVMDAVTSGYKDLEGLPSRNKARMREQGIQKCATRLESCRQV